MTHRVNPSGSSRLGGFTGRVLAIAAATALCVAAIALTVSMCSGPSDEPRPVTAPSGSIPSTEIASSTVPSTTAASSSAVTSSAPSSTSSPAPRPTTTEPAPEPTTVADEPEPTTTVAPPARTAPRVTTTAPAAPRCTPHPQWVFRPSTGTYERITVPC